MPIIIEPQAHLWTKTEYQALAELGFFNAKRVELVEGAILEKSPMTSCHAAVVALVYRTLLGVLGAAYHITPQTPLDLGDASEPEPDIAVCAGTARDYLDHKPTHALLVVEVADSSLRYDRGKKASLYARAGIAEYWIVNLQAGLLEVYRSPAEYLTQPHNYGYKLTLRLTTQDTVSPLFAPDIVLAVADLLP